MLRTLSPLALLLAGTALGEDQHESAVLEPGTSDYLYGEAVSLDGDRIAVGATDTPQSGSGAVYVYEKVGNDWVLLERVVSPDGVDGDKFGGGVLLREDLLVVGATHADDSDLFSGAAYVFRESGGSWTFEQKLAHNAGLGDEYGAKLALEGDTLVVSGEESGKVWIYEYDGAGWPLVTTLSESGVDETYGAAVALRGGVLAIGEHDGGANESGKVHVYEQQAGSWVRTAELLATPNVNDAAFGCAVAVDGDRLLAGAYAESGRRGAAYVFVRQGAGWVQEQKLTAHEVQTESYFGWSVALDGQLAAIGNRAYDLPVPHTVGAVEVFARDAQGWHEYRRLLASQPAQSDLLGWSVALEGRRVVGGALQYGPAGGALVFELGCGIARNVCTSTPNSSGQSALIGWSGELSVAADDFQLLATGAPPGELAMFLSAREGAKLPFGNGFLCLSSAPPGIDRIRPALTIDASGGAMRDFPLGGFGGVAPVPPGARRFFQLYFRDAAAGGAGFDFSDALDVVFCP